MSLIPTSALAYVATPYTKRADIEKAFVDAAKLCALLLRAGIKAYSPIVYTHCISLHGCLDPLDHDFWMIFDQAMMKAADVLIVAHMDGWQESDGIAEEIAFFEAAGKPIFDLDPKTLMMTKRRGPLVYESSLAHNKRAREQGGASV